MGEAGHPNVTSALDLLEDEGWFYIVMPFLPGGDLYNCVERNGAFHEPECFHFCKQVTDGLRGLHSLGVAHNDMSLENTMLDSRDRAVIIGAHLSLSLSLSLSRSLSLAPVSPPPLTAPLRRLWHVHPVPARGEPARPSGQGGADGGGGRVAVHGRQAAVHVAGNVLGPRGEEALLLLRPARLLRLVRLRLLLPSASTTTTTTTTTELHSRTRHSLR